MTFSPVDRIRGAATTCPPESMLCDFGLGKLDEASADTVSRHLETCADCQGRVAALPGDSFVGQLRNAGAAGRRDRSGETLSAAASKADATWTERDGLRSPSSAPPELANHADYELIEELGRGGMGTVYLAKNRLMDRLEVLKLITPALLDRPGALERFQQEIRSAARLAHPNIVAAYSVLRAGESLVFAMEYVKGHDLARVVKGRGYLPVANAALYVHQVALGLQHAHEKGMVHRDIKPNNLMLAADGKKHVVKILDFGLAKASSEKDAETGLTASGQMLGTPAYMAPEQTLDAHQADIRADIYSLGCTLYFLLSGVPPFQEASLYELLEAHHKREPAALNLLRPDIPVELAAVVTKMLAKQPAKRYQTPAEVAVALAPFFKPGRATGAASSPASLDASLSQPAIDTAPEIAAVPQIAVVPRAYVPVAVPMAPPLMAVAAPVRIPVNDIAGRGDFSIDTRRSSRRRSGLRTLSPSWLPWVAAAGAAALLVLGVVLVVRTSRGTVKVALNDADDKLTVTVAPQQADPEEPRAGDAAHDDVKLERTISSEGAAVEGPPPVPPDPRPPDQKVPVAPMQASGAAPGKAMDLLALIDLRRDAAAGEWQMADGALIAPATPAAYLELPYEPRGEYKLTAIVECAKHKDWLQLSLNVGESQTVLCIDVGGWAATGLHLVDKRPMWDNDTTKHGPFLQDGRPNTIVCTVRATSVDVTCNDTPLVHWIGDSRRLSMDPPRSIRDPRRLFIGSNNVAFRFTALRIEPLEALGGKAPANVPPAARLLPAPSKPAAAAPERFVTLFNGRDLKDWRFPTRRGGLKCEDGVVRLARKNDYLLTNRTAFKNFKLRMELSASKDTKAFIVVHQKGLAGYGTGITSTIHDDGKRILAGLSSMNFAAKEHGTNPKPTPYDQFFTLELSVNDLAVGISVDGQSTSDFTYTRGIENGQGALGCVVHSGKLTIRKIEIKEVP